MEILSLGCQGLWILLVVMQPALCCAGKRGWWVAEAHGQHVTAHPEKRPSLVSQHHVPRMQEDARASMWLQ